ncbi:hypothetical protein [Janthinobacterium lividum]|uniref:hypothetical protein n=1 Tax=Janthinobacterium lividum TaxID=29581 RepID=UPI000FE27D6D|nr:hypothetical protein [Janthinobacterium lividum]
MQAFGVGAFLAGARLRAWPAGRKNTGADYSAWGVDSAACHAAPISAIIVPHAAQACGNAILFMVIHFSCVLPVYSSLNLNVAPLNKPGEHNEIDDRLCNGAQMFMQCSIFHVILLFK